MIRRHYRFGGGARRHRGSPRRQQVPHGMVFRNRYVQVTSTRQINCVLLERRIIQMNPADNRPIRIPRYSRDNRVRFV